MSLDLTVSTRVSITKEMLAKLQHEAIARGLDLKNPSALVSHICRKWLEQSGADLLEALAARVTAIENEMGSFQRKPSAKRKVRKLTALEEKMLDYLQAQASRNGWTDAIAQKAIMWELSVSRKVAHSRLDSLEADGFIQSRPADVGLSRHYHVTGQYSKTKE